MKKTSKFDLHISHVESYLKWNLIQIDECLLKMPALLVYFNAMYIKFTFI